MVIIRSHYCRNKGRQFHGAAQVETNSIRHARPGPVGSQCGKKLKLHWRTPQSSLNRLTSVRSLLHHASRSRKPCATRARILPPSRPRRSMIGAYGDTACSPGYDSQARKPQLGASHSVRSRSRYSIRTAGQATATHSKNVYLLA